MVCYTSTVLITAPAPPVKAFPTLSTVLPIASPYAVATLVASKFSVPAFPPATIA